MMATPFEPLSTDASAAQPDVAPKKPIPAPFAGKSAAEVLRARLILGLGTPLAVAVVALLGWVVLTSFVIPLHGREMAAACIISVVGGAIALAPLMILIRSSIDVLLRLVMVAMLLRIAVTLAGILLAAGPGWKLSLLPLALWSCVLYFAVMAVETALCVWVVRR